jgi:hypothetical protein
LSGLEVCCPRGRENVFGMCRGNASPVRVTKLSGVETRQVGYEFKSLIYCSRNEIYIRKLHCSSELHEPCIEVYGLMSELDPSYHILRPQ